MSLSDLAILRHLVDEQTEDPYGNAFLQDVIDDNTTIEAAAAFVWGLKAARYAALVDVAEAGASRKMSQLHLQALAMAKSLGGSDGTGDGTGTDSTRFTVTRPIERV